MPRVTHIKRARKARPEIGIAVGDSFYEWKFRFGGYQRSKTPPTRAQLTQSAYKGQLYNLQDRVSEFSVQPPSDDADWTDVESILDSLKSQATEFLSEVRDEIVEMRDQSQESLDNMPEQLQYAPTGELLQSRIDGGDEAEGTIDSAESEVDNVETEQHTDEEEGVDWEAVAGDITTAVSDNVDLDSMEGEG